MGRYGNTYTFRSLRCLQIGILFLSNSIRPHPGDSSMPQCLGCFHLSDHTAQPHEAINSPLRIPYCTVRTTGETRPAFSFALDPPPLRYRERGGRLTTDVIFDCHGGITKIRKMGDRGGVAVPLPIVLTLEPALRERIRRAVQ